MASTKKLHMKRKQDEKSVEKTVVIFFQQNNLPLLQTVIFILGEYEKFATFSLELRTEKLTEN